MKVEEFLKEHAAPFEVLDHPAAFSAQRMAHAVHVAGDRVAKTVLLKADRGFQFYLAVLPATHQVDLARVREAMGVADVELATEQDIADRCRDCEVGAMPPFGSQIGAETIVDDALARGEDIVFEGNRHDQAIRMKYRDFYELEHPLVVQIAARN